MSKKLILHVGAGTLSMETKGFRGPECLKAHEHYKSVFGHTKPISETQTPTEEMNLPAGTPEVKVQG